MKKGIEFITIECNVHFGSKFQEETALKALEGMLQAWANHYTNSHKGNSVECRINTFK